MSQEFVPDDNSSDRPNDDSAAVSEQEVVLLTVVGSPEGCQGNHTHFVPTRICPKSAIGVPVQRAANPKQVMSVLIRRSRANGTPPRKSEG
jgi:hypothetical protein